VDARQCRRQGGGQLMSSGQPTQLPLGIKLRDEATFDNYFTGSNTTVLAALHGLADPSQVPAERCIYLWGAPGSGRSHLLQAACHRMAEAGAVAMYLPLREVLDHGPLLLDGMEELDLVCLDDLEVLGGQADWEEALFHLYNRIQQRQGRLLMSASAAPRGLELQLPDLISRLGWGLVFQLQAL